MGTPTGGPQPGAAGGHVRPQRGCDCHALPTWHAGPDLGGQNARWPRPRQRPPASRWCPCRPASPEASAGRSWATSQGIGLDCAPGISDCPDEVPPVTETCVPFLGRDQERASRRVPTYTGQKGRLRAILLIAPRTVGASEPHNLGPKVTREREACLLDPRWGTAWRGQAGTAWTSPSPPPLPTERTVWGEGPQGELQATPVLRLSKVWKLKATDPCEPVSRTPGGIAVCDRMTCEASP